MILWYYMNWSTHDFWTRTGGWEIDRSHGAGTSSPSHWQQVEEQGPKPDSRQAELFAKNVDNVRPGQSSQNGNRQPSSKRKCAPSDEALVSDDIIVNKRVKPNLSKNITVTHQYWHIIKFYVEFS